MSSNPAVADFFFFNEQISKFVQAFYVDVLGATDFWFRFESQHRESPHVHGLAWLPNAPDIEKLHTANDTPALLDVIEQITSYVDNLVTTVNPGIPAGGNNAVPQAKPSLMCATNHTVR